MLSRNTKKQLEHDLAWDMTTAKRCLEKSQHALTIGQLSAALSFLGIAFTRLESAEDSYNLIHER